MKTKNVAANCLKVKLIEKCQFETGDDHAVQNCKFLKLLLNEEVRSVSFTYLPDTQGGAMRSVTDAWFALTEKCPRLQKLACDDFYTTKGHRLVVFFSFALQFNSLQELDMPDLWCNDLRLELLAVHMPQLRCVHDLSFFAKN
jgi:hypothetical protein